MLPLAGGGGGCGLVEATLTLSNVDVFDTVVSWLVTTEPMFTLVGIAVDTLPTAVHVLPSLDTDPVMVDPVRASFNQTGNACDPPARNVVAPPSVDRVMNSRLPSGR